MLYRSAYDHQAHCSVVNVGDGDWAELDAAFEELVGELYKGKKKALGEGTTLARAGILADAMLEGYGKDFAAVDYDSPDLQMLKHLRANIWAFSGYSDHQMVKDLSAALLDENGKLRSENDFFKEAAKIGKIYNRDRLRVERNHAVGTSQMAARWAEFQQDRDVAPNLRYRTVGDGRVRDSHRALDNIVRPMDDPFWNTYYPPNDWGCRCSVQAEDGRTTEIEGKPLPVLKPMFKTNLAATGVLYPEGHPYFKVGEGDAGEIERELDRLGAKLRFVPENVRADYADKLGITVNEEIFSYLNRPVPFRTTEVGPGEKSPGAYFDVSNWSVHIPIDDLRRRSKWKAESVVYHEYGHAADWANGFQKSPLVKGLMEKYRKKLNAENGKRFAEVDKKLWELYHDARRSGHYDRRYQCVAAQDTLMSLDPRYGQGHGRDYWENEGFKEAEFIAHLFENRFVGNEVFREAMPELYAEMVELADRLHPLRQGQRGRD